MAKKKKKLHICVFCGASNDSPKLFLEMAYKLGKKLAKKNYTLVYGGANNGCMGAVANGCMENGGEVIGVFPGILLDKEVAHTGLTKLIIAENMSARKQKMYDLSDAFIILPGGLGTMDEYFEILTLKKLKGHTKPIIIYDFYNYWERLLKLLVSMVRHGFAGGDVFGLYNVAKTEEEIFDILKKI